MTLTMCWPGLHQSCAEFIVSKLQATRMPDLQWSQELASIPPLFLLGLDIQAGFCCHYCSSDKQYHFFFNTRIICGFMNFLTIIMLGFCIIFIKHGCHQEIVLCHLSGFGCPSPHHGGILIHGSVCRRFCTDNGQQLELFSDRPRFSCQ